jgi:CheY-like chemotaxis protein
MKRTIVVADRDESLQHAFMTVFSKDHFEIIYASTGKEVEKIAERIQPDVYIVNVNLPKMNGIEVYKKLQKQKFLETASFFFLKDESDRTELLGYQADGVIEKPLNFFRVYETVTKEDEVIELTDLIDEKPDLVRQQLVRPGGDDAEVSPGFVDEKPEPVKTVPVEEPTAVTASATPEGQVMEPGETVKEQPTISAATDEGHGPPEEAAPEVAGSSGDQSSFEERLRDAMDGLTGSSVARAEGFATLPETEGSHMELEAQFKVVLNQAMEEAALKLSARLAPILTHYVEDYVKRMLLEIAENVIREEIDKLLKESAG